MDTQLSAALRAAPELRWEVLFVLLPDSLVLDWAGPAEALRVANQTMSELGSAEPFRLRYVGPVGEASSSVGVTLAGVEPLPKVFERPTWIVLLGQPGKRIDVHNSATQACLRWLEKLRLQRGVLELLTVCTGAVIAAHAGLLHGRRATTHHQHLDELQSAAPGCHVVGNRVFVEDGPIFSSAGVTTGVDLVLQRISEVCGAAAAAEVAHTLVLPMRRGPQDPQLSPFLAHRNHLHPAVHRVQDAISHTPTHGWDLAAMASIAHTSPRHLNRLFAEHACVAPLTYLRQIRLTLAQHALRSGSTVTQAAEMAGFSSDTQLRRAWHQFGLRGTPSGAGE